MSAAILHDPPLIATREEATGRTEPAANAPIVVATDGTEASEPGLAVARVLAAASGSPVQLISVVQPMTTLLPSAEGIPAPSAEDRDIAEERLHVVREQQRRLGDVADWTVEVKFGDPATVLTRTAKLRNARVLVMGRRPHGKVDQLLGDDTVFDVMRLAETPVLIATRPMEQLPRIISVAVDFSDLSTAAALRAVRMFPQAGLMYLVHVQPRGETLGTLAAQYADSVRQGFERMDRELDPHTGARIDPVELTGVPARELVDFAESSRSELLVVGSYKRGLFRRLAGGAMASRLMRAAPCPVLIVPEAATQDVVEEEPEAPAAGLLPAEAIGAMLDELTRRNAGRRVLFESDNPRVGAQLLAFDYTFLAARLDAASEKVRLVLTDDALDSCQSVTHSLPKPADVEIRRALDGSDHVIRLASDCSRTTITFW